MSKKTASHRGYIKRLLAGCEKKKITAHYAVFTRHLVNSQRVTFRYPQEEKENSKH